MSAASFVLVVGLFAEAVSFSSGRPPECAGTHMNAWERAKAPTLRAYCDLVASATAKISSGKDSAKAALAETFEAEKLAPEKPYAWVLRGRALERLGRAEDAYAAFGEAKKRDPRSLEDPVVLLSYSRVLARTHRREEAEASYRALLPRASWLDSHERAFAYVEAGLLVMKKGPAQIDDAIAIFRQARAEAQDSSRALSTALLALALDRAGESAQAQAVLGDRTDVRVLSADPRIKDLFDLVSGADELDALAGEALARDKPQEAREAWQRYVKSEGPTGAWTAHASQKIAGGKSR